MERLNEANRKRGIMLDSLCLLMFVLLSFTHHIFLYTISYAAYIMLLFAVLVMSIIARGAFVLDGRSTSCLWLLPAIIVVVNFFLVSDREGGALFDILILLAGILYCILTRHKAGDYELCLKLLVFNGAVHSIGVLTAFFLPPVHRLLVSLLPSEMASLALSSPNRGFTVNSGFAAAFITVAMIALVCLGKRQGKLRARDVVLLIVLLLALLFTSKRAHPLFLMITLVLCYLAPLSARKRRRKLWMIFWILIACVFVFFAIRGVLAQIPFFTSMIETIDMLLAGEDITSSRSELAAWAWQNFLKYPVLGMGWGDYPASVVGNVTRIKELDAHNIYLQILCESGLVGFLVFLIPMLTFWFKAKKAFSQSVNSEDGHARRWKCVNMFSYAFQTFFLLYGLTGNPLYDPNWQLLYLLSCGIVASYYYSEKKRGLKA